MLYRSLHRLVTLLAAYTAYAAAAGSTDWAIEKYVLSIGAGTAVDIQNFFIRHRICQVKTQCPSALGCGGLRSWCIVDTPYKYVLCCTPQQLSFDCSSQEWPGTRKAELHFVDAPKLADLELEGETSVNHWIRTFEKINGNLTQFTGLMHDKLQLYSPVLDLVVASLASEQVPTMHRKSIDPAGTAVHHVGFLVAGRIFELVGRLSSSNEQAVESWSESECPNAHTIARPISWYDARAAGNRSLLLGISSSDRHRTQLPVLLAHLQRFSGADVKMQQTCDFASIKWPSMDGLTVRYVHNEINLPLGTIDRYHATIEEAHELFSRSAPWSSWWDRWLDQHVGLWYGGSEPNCTLISAAVHSALTSEQIPTAARSEPDARLYYAGYAGSMSWEYQWSNCDAQVADAPAECACDEMNVWSKNATCTKQPDTNWCRKHATSE